MNFEGQITANLPAVDFDQTALFYQGLGFKLQYQSAEWMIMRLGSMMLEFFHHPALDPQTSWHSACIRVQDIESYYRYWSSFDWRAYKHARITEIQHLAEIRQFCMIDLNGSLLRCIQTAD